MINYCYEHTFHGDEGDVKFGGRCLERLLPCILLPLNSLSTPASLHFSLHKRLSSARNLQFLHVCAALNRSRGSRKDKTYSANCNQ